jgi:hypothetical protein
MDRKQSTAEAVPPIIAKPIDLFEEETMQQARRSAEAREGMRPLWRAMWLILALCVTAFTLVPAGVRAQIAGTASVQGTVSDATGAVVAHANVALMNEATQVNRATVSDASGVYSFPSVSIGTYDLTVTAAGFKTYEQKGHRA